MVRLVESSDSNNKSDFKLMKWINGANAHRARVPVVTPLHLVLDGLEKVPHHSLAGQKKSFQCDIHTHCKTSGRHKIFDVVRKFEWGKKVNK